jgi:3-phenylpropionate/trans-cinnamate dioxygenase ferredoxin subunit
MISSRQYNVGLAANVPSGGAIATNAGGEIVAVFNIDGDFYAISDTCSHAEASLSEGKVDGHHVMCPLHGSEFDVRTGEVMNLPATSSVESFRIEVEDGDLIVTIP